ncbi:unnamed protein product [Lasius platythorax]|uniref:Uncharacterized protein n=1 Tax=Lasius platythorax TaxID=488582 RepID=A0AAV2NRF4_9HYME
MHVTEYEPDGVSSWLAQPMPQRREALGKVYLYKCNRHLRDPEESDAIAEEDGNDDDDDYDKDDDSDEGARRTSRAGKDRPNGSTRIVRRVLMDYPSTRKPVDQREFIVTAFTIDVYSYLDKRLDIDVTSECQTNTIISLTISDSA